MAESIFKYILSKKAAFVLPALDFVAAPKCLLRGRDATRQSPSYFKYAKCPPGAVRGKQEGAVLKGSTTLKVIKACVLIQQNTLFSALEVFVSRWCLPGEL